MAIHLLKLKSIIRELQRPPILRHHPHHRFRRILEPRQIERLADTLVIGNTLFLRKISQFLFDNANTRDFYLRLSGIDTGNTWLPKSLLELALRTVQF